MPIGRRQKKSCCTRRCVETCESVRRALERVSPSRKGPSAVDVSLPVAAGHAAAFGLGLGLGLGFGFGFGVGFGVTFTTVGPEVWLTPLPAPGVPMTSSNGVVASIRLNSVLDDCGVSEVALNAVP